MIVVLLKMVTGDEEHNAGHEHAQPDVQSMRTFVCREDLLDPSVLRRIPPADDVMQEQPRYAINMLLTRVGRRMIAHTL